MRIPEIAIGKRDLALCARRTVRCDIRSVHNCKITVGASISRSLLLYVHVDTVHNNERVVLAGRDGRPGAVGGLSLQCVPRVHP